MARRSAHERLMIETLRGQGPFRKAVRSIIEQGSKPAPPDPFGPVVAQAARNGLDTIRAGDPDVAEAMAAATQPHRPAGSRGQKLEAAAETLRNDENAQRLLLAQLEDGTLQGQKAERARELLERAGVEVDEEGYDPEDEWALYEPQDEGGDRPAHWPDDPADDAEAERLLEEYGRGSGGSTGDEEEPDAWINLGTEAEPEAEPEPEFYPWTHGLPQ